MRPVRHRSRAFHQVRMCVVIAAQHSQVRSPNMCTSHYIVAGMPLVRVAHHSSTSWVTRPKVKGRSDLQAARTLITQDQSRRIYYATVNGFISGETPETDRRGHSEKTFFLFEMSRSKATKQNNKSFVPTSPGVARDSFFLFLLFISLILLILLIEFNYVLTFLKDARERGAHDDCQSPLPGQVGPGLTV